MRLLKDLISVKENSDLSRLPQDVLTAIRSNIRKGAEDLQQQWANALELVHKAYEVEGVQRPDPTMDAAWKQYEEVLQYAVQQLAKNRGMEADWRMSSHIFHEARQPKQKFHVRVDDTSYLTEGDSIDSIINHLTKTFKDVDVNVLKEGNSRTLTFSKWGIKRPTRVVVEPVK